MLRQPFHLVEFSPWPILGSFSAFSLVSGLALWFHSSSLVLLFWGLFLTVVIMYQWWRDVVRESTFQGFHTLKVSMGLRYGMILFITSEILFFFAFFWAFFHSSLAPTYQLGCIWPPMGLYPINPFSIPLLNTAVLLASGVTVTWAHHSIVENNRQNLFSSLSLTVFLGMYFTFLQAIEYLDAPFSIADSVFGTTFFVATGFHGLHVLIGTVFLFISLTRTFKYHYSSAHHFGFEAAAWYWHFVDVVWIFLYLCIYWWGS